MATFFTVLELAVSVAAVGLVGSTVPAFATTTHPGPLNLDPYLTIQDKNLDCEAAALAAAFIARDISVDTGVANLQNWIFDQLPDDRRNAISSGGHITWGDPYTDFVGNVNGVEGFGPGDGYGVYYQPIANVVTKVGHTVTASTGWTTSSIEAEIELGIQSSSGSIFAASSVMQAMQPARGRRLTDARSHTPSTNMRSPCSARIRDIR